MWQTALAWLGISTLMKVVGWIGNAITLWRLRRAERVAQLAEGRGKTIDHVQEGQRIEQAVEQLSDPDLAALNGRLNAGRVPDSMRKRPAND